MPFSAQRTIEIVREVSIAITDLLVNIGTQDHAVQTDTPTTVIEGGHLALQIDTAVTARDHTQAAHLNQKNVGIRNILNILDAVVLSQVALVLPRERRKKNVRTTFLSMQS